MAAPITHIVVSQKVFDRHFPHLSKDAFFVGTSFPDIRYLRVITREKTHSQDVTLNTVKSAQSFHAGSLFHSLVDIVRESYMREHDIYSMMPDSKFITQTLKLLEDELLYERINNWDSIIGYFDNILNEELDYSIDKEAIQKWHDLLRHYFAQKPSQETRKSFFESINFDAESIKEIERNLSLIRKDQKVTTLVKGFYDSFESLLS